MAYAEMSSKTQKGDEKGTLTLKALADSFARTDTQSTMLVSKELHSWRWRRN